MYFGLAGIVGEVRLKKNKSSGKNNEVVTYRKSQV